MEIYVNGEPRRIAQAVSVAELLEELEYVGRRVAVEINSAIVPRSVYTQHRVQPGDRVEIVHAIGGG